MSVFMRGNSLNHIGLLTAMALFLGSCQPAQQPLNVTVYQTSAAGDQLKEVEPSVVKEAMDTLHVFLNKKQQTITGFGGAFTESSAHLLNQLGLENRKKVINAYFGDKGARYSLCRTHINSCDFSLSHYSYAPVDGDTLLDSFSITEDLDDIIPFIKEAQEVSKDGFKLIASPWTAPPWMKDNKGWKGGKLLPEYYDTWARFFVRYHQAYAEKGIDLWGYTVENEPLGNGENWESMHFEPQEMGTFVKDHLGPAFEQAGIESNILIYDQNRDHELKVWGDALLKDPELLSYIYGTAVHWYSSTVDWEGPALQYIHDLAPEKHIIHTEACVDAEVPHWKEDEWYWKKEATDWGWDWAPEEQKADHPKYVPAYRYARDIIGCLNNWVEGWIDWNMVLDKKGGPNHASNWCVAPVIVDPEADEVYFTPLYYVLTHFSRFMRPGSQVLQTTQPIEGMMATAVENPDGSVAVAVLNTHQTSKSFVLSLGGERVNLSIGGETLQTVLVPPTKK